MPRLDIIVDEQRVNDYLEEHGLEQGFYELEAVLLQAEGTASGAPCVLLIVNIDGKKRLVKTTFNLFDMARGALLGALQRLVLLAGERERGKKEGN
jgi:hypothetical protein